ncbi:MAG TPA: YciI family protein [Cyclobacteriaceae bacterium]|nr:YciI family protein [Cyclobacteriaceae bacterium]
MKRFLLLIREDLRRVEQLTDAQLHEEIQVMTKWVEELTKTGNFVSGEPLETGIRLATSTRVLSDGPFIEAKEAVTGYTLVKAANIDQAAELAMACPLVQNGQIKIEVRPILDFA